MATPLNIDARRYHRVAYQRLDDGRLLLEKLDRPKSAVYLTGYAVECILKALLLNVIPAKEHVEVLASFRGGGGHDLLRLRDRLSARGVIVPAAVAKELAYVSSWSVELRYDPGAGDGEDAARFIRAATTILNWANERI